MFNFQSFSSLNNNIIIIAILNYTAWIKCELLVVEIFPTS